MARSMSVRLFAVCVAFCALALLASVNAHVIPPQAPSTPEPASASVASEELASFAAELHAEQEGSILVAEDNNNNNDNNEIENDNSDKSSLMNAPVCFYFEELCARCEQSPHQICSDFTELCSMCA